MPLYMYVVRNQKVRLPVRVVVALPQGIVKVRFRTVLADYPLGAVCSYYGGSEEIVFNVDRVMALFWKSDGTLVTQTTVTTNDTDIDVPSGTAYVEWRIPSGATFTSITRTVSVGRRASLSVQSVVMGFIDQANNITNVTINLVFICSAWDQPVSVVSSTMPVNVDIPFCHDCSGDFSVRSALRSIYAAVTNAQNARLRAILLDSSKNMLVDCPWVNVGDVSQETLYVLCDETNTDLLTNLKANYPIARYIRIMIDRADPAGPLPAAMFSLYFSADKGSIP